MKQSPNKILFGIIFLGALLRFIGIWYNLPFITHDDEPIVVNWALSFGKGDLNPHMFIIPTLLAYILFVVYGIIFVVGYVLGIFENLTAFKYLYLNNPTIFFLTGRLLAGFVCGVITLLIFYKFVKRISSENIAFLSVLVLAVNYLHVRNSHYLYYDIPLTMMVSIFALYLSYLEENFNNIKYFIKLGIIYGITVATKYNGAFVLPLFLYVLWKTPLSLKDKIIRCLIVIISSIFMFYLCVPYALLDYRAFFSDISRIAVGYVGPFFHIKISILGAFGIFFSIFIPIGIYFALKEGNKYYIATVIYVLFYYFILIFKSQHAERYIMPIVPFLSFIGVIGIVSLYKRLENSALANIFPAILFLCITPSIVKDLYVDYLLCRPDTRVIAYYWVKENIPSGSKIALDIINSSFPVLPHRREQIIEWFNKMNRAVFNRSKKALKEKLELLLKNPNYPANSYYIWCLKKKPGLGFLYTFPDLPFDMEKIKETKIEYVIVSGLLYTKHTWAREFLEKLRKGATLVKRISPYKDKRRLFSYDKSNITMAPFNMKELLSRNFTGEVIEIYKIKYAEY